MQDQPARSRPFDPHDPTTYPVLLTVAEVAAVLRLNPDAVYDLLRTPIERGGLRPTLIGLGKRTKRVHRDDLHRYLNPVRVVSLTPEKRRRRTEGQSPTGKTFAERYGRVR